MDAAWHQDALTRETVRGLSTLDDEHRALVLALEHLPALGLEALSCGGRTPFRLHLGRPFHRDHLRRPF